MNEWRPIPGYDGYEVTADGRVRNAKSGRELKPRLNRIKGRHQCYMVVGLSVPRRPEERTTGPRGGRTVKQASPGVHRLVAMAFIPNPDNLPEVNHRDFNRTNNVASNLEWTTKQQNVDHAHAQGHYESSWCKQRRQRLTPDQVLELLTDHQAGMRPGALAKKYEIGENMVFRITSGRSWKLIYRHFHHGAEAPARRDAA